MTTSTLERLQQRRQAVAEADALDRVHYLALLLRDDLSDKETGVLAVLVDSFGYDDQTIAEHAALAQEMTDLGAGIDDVQSQVDTDLAAGERKQAAAVRKVENAQEGVDQAVVELDEIRSRQYAIDGRREAMRILADSYPDLCEHLGVDPPVGEGRGRPLLWHCQNRWSERFGVRVSLGRFSDAGAVHNAARFAPLLIDQGVPRSLVRDVVARRLAYLETLVYNAGVNVEITQHREALANFV